MKTTVKDLIKEDPSWFVEQLRKVRAFSVLSDKELRHVVSQMRIFNFKAGATIVNQGEMVFWGKTSCPPRLWRLFW